MEPVMLGNVGVRWCLSLSGRRFYSSLWKWISAATAASDRKTHEQTCHVTSMLRQQSTLSWEGNRRQQFIGIATRTLRVLSAEAQFGLGRGFHVADK